jgi:hypothetical protein
MASTHLLGEFAEAAAARTPGPAGTGSGADDASLVEPLVARAAEQQQQQQHEPAAEAPLVTRLYVMAAFGLFSFNQGMQWLTFSAVDPARVVEYFGPRHMDAGTIALLLNWGPIMGVAAAPFQAWLAAQPQGLRRSVVAGAALVLVSSALRVVPALSPALQRSDAALVSVHLAQIVNACAGPLCMGVTARLSKLWYPKRERTLAIAAAITFNSLGSNAAFLMGPALSISRFLWIELALAVLSSALIALHFPRSELDLGPGAPAGARNCDGGATSISSVAGAGAGAGAGEGEGEGEGEGIARVPNTQAAISVATSDEAARAEAPSGVSFRRSLRLLGDRHYAVAVLSAGAFSGAAIAWQSQFQSILKADFGEQTIGALGFANGAASMSGTLLWGLVAKQHRLFRELIALLALNLLFVLLVAELLGDLPGARLVNDSAPAMLAVVIAAGLAYGASQPLWYELCAKLTSVNEGTSVGVLIAILNVFCCVLIAASPYVDVTYILLGTTLVVALGVAYVGAAKAIG